jgi:signal transduction histidine kinase
MQDVVNDVRPVSRVPWRSLPLAARVYVTIVVASGAVCLGVSVPTTFPEPVLFISLAVFACVTSMWKVTLPIAVANGSTLSASYAAIMTSLLVLGPRQAALIAVAGVVVQCCYKPKAPYPIYRTIFSAAAAGITISATGAVYMLLGGTTPPPASFALAKPLVAAIGTYFLINTSLVAGAIALSSNRTFGETWGRDFLLSAANFMVAGTAGALTAMVVERGEHWIAVVLLAPIYLTYRSYELFAGRLEYQKRHTEAMRRLNRKTMAALEQARSAERRPGRGEGAPRGRPRRDDAAGRVAQPAAAARAGGTRGRRGRQPAQRSVSRDRLARITHAVERRARMGGDAVATRGRGSAARSGAAWHFGGRPAAGATDRGPARRREHHLRKMRLDRTLVDLGDVINDALLIAQPSAAAKQIRLSFERGAWTPKIFGDRVRLEQVASNLISNAVKFTPDAASSRYGCGAPAITRSC